MKRNLFACTMLIPVLLVGCTPGPQPTPPPTTPAPTVEPPPQQFMCTPEEGGHASPCSEAEYQAQLARDKQYDEAKRVLAAYNKEFERLAREGATASEELLSYTAGDYTDLSRDEFSQGYRYEGGEFKTVWVKRLVGESQASSVVALRACTDTTSITIMQNGKKLTTGRVAEEEYYFADSTEGLKIVEARNTQVESC